MLLSNNLHEKHERKSRGIKLRQHAICSFHSNYNFVLVLHEICTCLQPIRHTIFFNVFSYAGKLIGSAVFCFYKITIDFFSAVNDRFCTNQGTHSSCDLFYKWQSS